VEEMEMALSAGTLEEGLVLNSATLSLAPMHIE
jgi:hypothetical protein